MTDRLDAVGEEALLTLVQDKSEEERGQRRLLLVAYEENGGAHLEFIAATGDENLQDRIALLGVRTTEDLIEQEVSLRLLRHLASSVRHQPCGRRLCVFYFMYPVACHRQNHQGSGFAATWRNWELRLIQSRRWNPKTISSSHQPRDRQICKLSFS